MLRPFKKRIRSISEMNLYCESSDIEKIDKEKLMEFCNSLAEKVDELVEENNRLQIKIKDVESRLWRE